MRLNGDVPKRIVGGPVGMENLLGSQKSGMTANSFSFLTLFYYFVKSKSLYYIFKTKPCEVNLAGKQVFIENRGTPSLARLPLFHPPLGRFDIHPLRSVLRRLRVSPSADGSKCTLPLWKPHHPLKKGNRPPLRASLETETSITLTIIFSL